MTAPAGGPADEQEAAPVRRRRTHQPRVARRRRRRRRLLVSGFVVLVLLGLGGWLAVTALHARGELEQARARATTARAAVLAGDPVTARGEATAAAAAAAAARADTSTLPWVLASHVPVVGTPFDAVRRISAAVDDLASDVLGPASEAALALSPATVRPAPGRVDVAALAAARPALSQASAAATELDVRVRDIPVSSWVPQVENARTELVTQSADLTSLLRDTSTAATLLPSMLGGDGPRSYFVAFQNNSEARGTGGLVGAFGILRADGGSVALEDRGANSALRDAPTAPSVSPDFDQLYGRYGSSGSWVNSNLSPDFPTVGRVWTSLWAQQSGEQLDGAVATDPVALGYLLGATGPVVLPDGQVVTADTVVDLTESQVYARFPDDAERKAYLQTISTAVVGAVTSGAGGDTTALLRALGRAAGEGRLAVWSSHPEEQAVLAATPLGRGLPTGAAPYAGVTVNNSGNGKLDYYLGRDVVYRAGACDGDVRRSTVTVTLTSSAPRSGLPDYVTIQNGPGEPGPPGTNRSNLALHATQGAQLTGVQVDGVDASAGVGVEGGHPVYTVPVRVLPGGSVVVVYELQEPTAAGSATVPAQPLVRPQTVTTAVPDCAAR